MRADLIESIVKASQHCPKPPMNEEMRLALVIKAPPRRPSRHTQPAGGSVPMCSHRICPRFTPDGYCLETGMEPDALCLPEVRVLAKQWSDMIHAGSAEPEPAKAAPTAPILNCVPVPMILNCPSCSARHIDVGAFATKIHHTHACQACGMVWRPAISPTVGVQFLPGFKDASPAREPSKNDCGAWEESATAEYVAAHAAWMDALLNVNANHVVTIDDNAFEAWWKKWKAP